MPKRKMTSLHEEISKWMTSLDEEIHLEADSDCETDEDVGKKLEDLYENEANIESEEHQQTEENCFGDNKTADGITWHPVNTEQKAIIYKFEGKNQNLQEATKSETEREFFKCVFPDSLTALIVEETNRYAAQLQDDSEIRTNSHQTNWAEVSDFEMKQFFALTLLMGHVGKDHIKDYWSTNKLIETPFFRKIMARDRYLSILKFLHFEDNENAPNQSDTAHDRLWKIRRVFETLNDKFKEVYEPTEEVFATEMIVSYRGRVVFRHYHSRYKHLPGVKIYKLVDRNGYTYDIKEYIQRDAILKGKKGVAQATLKRLVNSIKGKGHKLFIDSFFSSPKTLVELHENFKINSCGTVERNCSGYPQDLKPALNSKEELNAKFALGMTALWARGKQEVFMLSNMHDPLEESGNSIRSDMVSTYNRMLGITDTNSSLLNSYTFSKKSLKHTKKLFFHLLDIAVFNAFVLFKMKNPNAGFANFRVKLIDQLIHEQNEVILGSAYSYTQPEEPEEQPNNPQPAEQQEKAEREKSEQHWPIQEKRQRRCAVCSKVGIRRRTSVSCTECDVGLCINCFELYHEKFRKNK